MRRLLILLAALAFCPAFGWGNRMPYPNGKDGNGWSDAQKLSIGSSGFLGTFSPVLLRENRIIVGRNESYVLFKNASRWEEHHRWRERELSAVHPVAVPEGDSWGLLLTTVVVLGFAMWHSRHGASLSRNLPHSL